MKSVHWMSPTHLTNLMPVADKSKSSRGWAIFKSENEVISSAANRGVSCKRSRVNSQDALLNLGLRNSQWRSHGRCIFEKDLWFQAHANANRSQNSGCEMCDNPKCIKLFNFTYPVYLAHVHYVQGRFLQTNLLDLIMGEQTRVYGVYGIQEIEVNNSVSMLIGFCFASFSLIHGCVQDSVLICCRASGDDPFPNQGLLFPSSLPRAFISCRHSLSISSLPDRCSKSQCLVF